MKLISKTFYLLSCGLLAASCSPSENVNSSASKSSGQLDRLHLPIQPPEAVAVTELDARNVKTPKAFNITPPKDAPNVLLIMLDDIGYGATEPFGGDIKTPTLNKLAKNGLRYSRFHTTALCSPTRASLLSGRNHHLVNVGSVMEVATGFPGNQGRRPDNAKYVAETLRQNGFATAAFGKWHETAPWEVSTSGPFFRWPTNSGFDKFYGFIGGETNQWDPMIFDGTTVVEKSDDKDYHFTNDITDQTIDWVRKIDSLTPDKPFFVYYAPGAVHAPHHAPKSYIKKYKGQFADGWQAMREKTIQRQKAMGLIPQNTELPPMPEDLKNWATLSKKERLIYERQMEAFAGFMEHTDVQIGRIIDSLDNLGKLDNTLVMYVIGDNGSSAEGGIEGTVNELKNLNGIFTDSSLDEMYEKLDAWGDDTTYPHFSSAWAVATNAPFRWTKQVAGDFGGTRNGMIVHWPKGIKAKGEIRSQFSHVNDVAPTILEATNIPAPETINGIKQIPMSGTSMIYSFDDGQAKERHTKQYFEMFGNRAMYKDGWLARVVHKAPWRPKVERSLQEDKWELYNTKEDFALVNDLSGKNPKKLKELQDLFQEEAIKNNVLPLDDRTYERFNAAVAGRPDLMQGRTSLQLYDNMGDMLENTFINIKNRSFSIDADLALNGSKERGVILSQGGRFGGWALYMDNGKPAFTYNWFGLEQYTVKSNSSISGKNAKVRLVFKYEGKPQEFGKGGTADLYVDNQKVGSTYVKRTVPFVFAADEPASVSKDQLSQVADRVFKDAKDSQFTGYVNKVQIKTGEESTNAYADDW